MRMVDKPCRICTTRIGEVDDYARMSGELSGRGHPPGWFHLQVCSPCAWFYAGEAPSVFEEDLAAAKERDRVAV